MAKAAVCKTVTEKHRRFDSYPAHHINSWADSSIGRTSALQAEGCGFKSRSVHQINLISLFGDGLIGRTIDSGSISEDSNPSLRAKIFGGRLIGKTADFGSAKEGSSPSP